MSFLGGGRRLIAAAAAVACAAALAGTAPAVGLSGRESSAARSTSTSTLTVASYNLMREGRSGRKWAPRRPHAIRLLRRLAPDVVGVQEGGVWMRQTQALGPGTGLLDRMGLAVATPPGTRGPNRDDRGIIINTPVAIGYKASKFELVRNDKIRAGDYGTGTLAAWAELRDKRTGRSFAVVNLHMPAGRSGVKDRARGTELRQLRTQLAQAGLTRLPMVILGDFNTRKGGARRNMPNRVMRQTGFVDSVAVARKTTKAELNTYNGLKRKAASAGHHLDHIWVPRGTTVSAWQQAARVRKGRYVGKMPSDHNPIGATLTLR